jgi:hypothetical protein
MVMMGCPLTHAGRPQTSRSGEFADLFERALSRKAAPGDFGGKIMCDLVLERPTKADDFFFIPVSGAVYPVEPLRSIG